jgi:hypothetical protein
MIWIITAIVALAVTAAIAFLLDFDRQMHCPYCNTEMEFHYDHGRLACPDCGHSERI